MNSAVRLLLAHVHLLDAVAEDRLVELRGGRDVARLALVPLERPGLVRELRAVVAARLPDAEDAPVGSCATVIRPASKTSNGSASTVPPASRIFAAVSSTSSLAMYVVQCDGIPSCCGGLAAATCFPRSVNIV